MPAGNEEQFKFLISCIRYSNNGKVDFGEVASECGIVTKGAAAKRYERMMKAHGIAPNAASVRSSSAIPRAPKVVSNKKRKAEQFADERPAVDDDEGLDNIIKSELKNSDRMMVKEEVMQHQMYSPGNMGEELGLELMSVKEEPMTRGYDDQVLNQYVHLSNGETLFGSNGLDSMNAPRSASHYGDLEVTSRDGAVMNNYFANMEHAYGVPAQDAYGLGSFEGEELIMVDAHGRPT